MEEGQGKVQGGFGFGADSSPLLAAGEGVLGSKGGCMVESQQLGALGPQDAQQQGATAQARAGVICF